MDSMTQCDLEGKALIINKYIMSIFYINSQYILINSIQALY